MYQYFLVSEAFLCKRASTLIQQVLKIDMSDHSLIQLSTMSLFPHSCKFTTSSTSVGLPSLTIAFLLLRSITMLNSVALPVSFVSVLQIDPGAFCSSSNSLLTASQLGSAPSDSALAAIVGTRVSESLNHTVSVSPGCSFSK